jgi:hypothetical protein
MHQFPLKSTGYGFPATRGCQTTEARCILIRVQDGAIKDVLILLMRSDLEARPSMSERRRKRTELYGGRLS